MGENKLTELEQDKTGDAITWQRTYSGGDVVEIELSKGHIKVFLGGVEVGRCTIWSLVEWIRS